MGSPLSFADSEPLYYWDIAYLDGRNVYFQGESARKACNELIAYINRRGGSVVYKELNYNLPYPDNRSWVVVDDIIASSVSGSTAYCNYFNSFNQISQERMRKYKKDCPVGSGLSYDMDTGAVVCADKNPCEEKKGQLVSFFAKHSLGWGNDPLYFCMKGCRIMRVASECAGHNDDPINNRACWGMAEYSQGKQCTEGETAATEGGSPPPKDKTPEPPKEPEEPKDPNQPDPEQCPAGYFFNGSFCSPIEPDNEGCPEGQVKQGSHCVTPPPTDAPPKKGGGSSSGGGSGTGGGSGSGSDKGNGSGDGKGEGKGDGKGDGKGKGGTGGGGTGTGKGECKEGEDCQKEEKSKVEGQSCEADWKAWARKKRALLKKTAKTYRSPTSSMMPSIVAAGCLRVVPPRNPCTCSARRFI